MPQNIYGQEITGLREPVTGNPYLYGTMNNPAFQPSLREDLLPEQPNQYIVNQPDLPLDLSNPQATNDNPTRRDRRHQRQYDRQNPDTVNDGVNPGQGTTINNYYGDQGQPYGAGLYGAGLYGAPLESSSSYNAKIGRGFAYNPLDESQPGYENTPGFFKGRSGQGLKAAHLGLSFLGKGLSDAREIFSSFAAQKRKNYLMQKGIENKREAALDNSKDIKESFNVGYQQQGNIGFIEDGGEMEYKDGGEKGKEYFEWLATPSFRGGVDSPQFTPVGNYLFGTGEFKASSKKTYGELSIEDLELEMNSYPRRNNVEFIKQRIEDLKNTSSTRANRNRPKEDGGVITFENGGAVTHKNGGQAGIERLLLDAVTGIPEENKKMISYANAEVEEDEWLIYPDGEIAQVKGDEHKEGGEKMQLPEGTKIVSNNVLIHKDHVDLFKKKHGVETSTKDTYADVLVKLRKKIGTTQLNDEQEDRLKQLKKNEDIKDDETREVNEEFLSEKIKDLEDQKKDKSKVEMFFADLVFQKQEEAKEKADIKKEEETVPEQQEQSDFDGENIIAEDGAKIPVVYRNGAYHTTDQKHVQPFKAWAKKKGFKNMQEVGQYLDGGKKKYQDGQQLGQSDQVADQVAALLQNGVAPDQVVAQLVQSGMDANQASQLVQQVSSQMQQLEDGGGKKKRTLYADGGAVGKSTEDVIAGLNDGSINPLEAFKEIFQVDENYNITKEQLIDILNRNFSDDKLVEPLAFDPDELGIKVTNTPTEEEKFAGNAPDVEGRDSKELLQSFADDLSQIEGFDAETLGFNIESGDLGKEAGKLQKWLIENQPEAVFDYFVNQGTPITSKGVKKIHDEKGEKFIKDLGVNYQSNPANYSDEERLKIQNAYLETLPDDQKKKDFILDQFNDNLWAFRKPGIKVNTPGELELTEEQTTTKPYNPAGTTGIGFGSFDDQPWVRTPHMRNLPVFLTPQLDRVNPYKVSPEEAIVEAARAGRLAAESSELGAGREANLSNIQRVTSEVAAKAVSDAERTNAELAFKADQINLQQSNTEEFGRIDAFNRYEPEAQARFLDNWLDWSNYYQQVYENNQDAVRGRRERQTLDAMADNFTYDVFGNVVVDRSAEVSPFQNDITAFQAGITFGQGQKKETATTEQLVQLLAQQGQG